MFQSLKQLSFILVLMSLVFSSCQKDELLDQNVQPDKVQPKEKTINGMMNRASLRSDGLEVACFVINYPFTVIDLEDNSKHVITSQAEFEQLLQNQQLTGFDFQYPLSVTDKDGNDVTITTAEALGEQFASCVPDTGWGGNCPDWFFPAWLLNLNEHCYELTYPLTLKGLDSTLVTVNDEAEFIQLLSDGKPYSFTFPLKLKDAQGDVITVDDDKALLNILSACNSGGGGVLPVFCYETVFPVSFKMQNGTTETANNEDEFHAILFSGNVIGYAYPIQLKDEQGNILTVNSDEEFAEALEECTGGIIHVDTDFFCYNFDFPISVTNQITGDVKVINSSDEWKDHLFQNSGAVDLNVFPYTLTSTKDGSKVTVNNELELMQAIEDCF